jgi:hypothetical protein
VSLAHTQWHAQRLIEEILTWHGDKELEDAITPQHRFRAQPATRHLKNDLTTPHEHDAAVGDDHACRQIDVVAYEEDLSFPNDAVSL